MDCIVGADASLLGYLGSLWCVVKSQIFETYTALAICIALAGLILWPLRKKFGGIKAAKPFSVASAIWAIASLFLGLVLSVIFIAPYSPYRSITYETIKLKRDNYDLSNMDKEKTVEKLREFLQEGRYHESDLEVQVLTPILRTRIKIWREQVGLYLDISRYKQYAALLTDDSLMPRIHYQEGRDAEWRKTWKLVVTTNFRLAEIIRRIKTDGTANHE